MTKKNTTTDTEQSPSFVAKALAVCKNETVRFIIGLLFVIFAVYLLLAFASFFFTGAADQSIIDNATAEELASVNNGVKNYAGSRGAQLASYLINDCFGISSFFIPVFLAMLGLKLMKVRRVHLRKWFVICALLLVWFSVFFGFVFVDQYKDSFLYLGGMHGYNVSNWLVSQIGVPGVWLLLLAVALCFLIYLSARTVVWLRGLFTLSFLKRTPKDEAQPEEADVPFVDPGKQKQPVHAATEQDGHASVKPEEPKPEHIAPADIPLHVVEEEKPLSVDIPLDIDKPSSPQPSPPPAGEVDMNIEVAKPDPLVSVPDKPGEKEVAFGVETAEDDYVGQEREPYNPRLDLENYHFPTLDLLKQFDNDGPIMLARVQLLEETSSEVSDVELEAMMRAARGTSSKSALPSPMPTTLRAGQPMLMSRDAKHPSSLTRAAASPMTTGSRPKSWQAVLVSSGCTASSRR